ncbi:ATP-binding cassette domain-containing protein [Fusobacterium necrophorum]|uniref:ATP-binding cassette domain-containing protein n=1 Tax=Fusobacterium necrophorum TaxID=859 RepID=UPI003BB7E32C
MQEKHLNLWIQEKHLLKQISLSISEREIVGLVGESGSGRLYLQNVFLGILPESANMTYDGFEVRTELGAVFQNAFTSLNPTMKIGKQLKHLYILIWK